MTWVLDVPGGEGTGATRRNRARHGRATHTQGVPGEPERYDRRTDRQLESQLDRPADRRFDHRADRLRAGSRNGGRVGVTYKYFCAPDGATAARVPISMRPEELGGDDVLITEATRAALAPGAFELSERPSAPLKGKREPVRLWALESEVPSVGARSPD